MSEQLRSKTTRDRRNRGNRGHEERYQLNEGEDARNAITHNRVTRNRSRRAAQEEESDSSSSEDELEPYGALCFSRCIRETRMPKGFRVTSETPNYDGLQEPSAWLEDYLTAVTCQRGSTSTAMQYIQLMLSGSARAWLKSLPRGGTLSLGGKNEAKHHPQWQLIQAF